MSTRTITVIERATVTRINEEHQACERAYGDALAHAIEAGRLLGDVKAQLSHGEWLPWVQEHFDGSEDTAQNYMRLARHVAAGELDTERARHLSIRGALAEVKPAKPKRATASDAGALLQSLGGSSGSSEVSRRLDEARERLAATAPATAWTEPERRKADRAAGMLADAGARIADAQTASLSRFSIGEIVREAANQTRKAGALLDELAFSFER